MTQTNGVLLVNLGSPDSTKREDVRTYLDEFLMDKRVIDVPYWLRTFIVRGIILKTRPERSAQAYKSIWWEDGSPLIVLTKRLLEKVRVLRPDIPVALGMRYGNPNIKSGIEHLLRRSPDLSKILLVPLYPHYAMSSYESVVVKAEEVIRADFPNLKMHPLPPFYNDDAFNAVLGDSIKEYLPAQFDKVLFSYHGLPERHIRKTDPTSGHCLSSGICCEIESEAHSKCYRHQVLTTTRRMADQLGLEKDQYITAFQSRLGWDKWLTPSTENVLRELPAKGVKKLAVVCPAFVSDCLETIEEIGMQGRQLFLESGGERLTLIPCLNDRADWAKVLATWIRENADYPIKV